MGREGKPYTTGEVAALCHVTINAVKKWIASGKISAFRTPGGHYRINEEDFKTFLEEYRMEIKEEVFPDTSKVLIVDDEPQIREFLKGALETESIAFKEDGTGKKIKFEVETAGDGYEGLIKVGDFKPDLLILDIRMPRIDGFELCRRLRSDEKTRDIKILAITAFGKEDRDKIIECGADNCLPKPIVLDEFRKNIARLLK